MFTIRELNKSDEEFEAIAKVLTAIVPDEPQTGAQAKYYDNRWDENYYREQFVIEVDGEIVGVSSWGEMPWSYRPGKYYFEADVHPDFEELGVDEALYQRMQKSVAQREHTPIMYTSSARDDQEHAIQFLLGKGFEKVMSWPGSRLLVEEFDAAPFARSVQKAEEHGIVIRTLAEQRALDPNYQREIYELDWACTLDEPQPDKPTKQPFARFAKNVFEKPTLIPEAFFLAFDGDQYVGLSWLEKDWGDPEKLETGFTAVLGSHRRRGICTALKLRALEYARAQGAKKIDTGNEENNPMFHINLRMGFKPKPAWSAYEKKLI